MQPNEGTSERTGLAQVNQSVRIGRRGNEDSDTGGRRSGGGGGAGCGGQRGPGLLICPSSSGASKPPFLPAV